MSRRVALVKLYVSEEHSASIIRVTVGELVKLRRMVSSGMLRHVSLVRTDVSEELSASIRVILDIYRRPDGLSGTQSVPQAHSPIFTSTPGPIITHPISKSCYLL
jgi:hypothetical protein